MTDNGLGLPADVVERLLDFNVLVSDKSAHRSPTRGAQGNAFKTLLGIPYVIGVSEPVVIEAYGVRHDITVMLDPGGHVIVEHHTSESTRTVGTLVMVPLPRGQTVDVECWVQKMALVNPHAEFTYLANGYGSTDRDFYKCTAQDGCGKLLPTDPTSPHWYDAAALRRLVFAHIGHVQQGGADTLLSKFIGSFQGLSGSAKQRKVRAAVPGVQFLSEFAQCPDKIDALLTAMQSETRPTQPKSLGEVDEDHYRDLFERLYGVEQWWFKRKRLLTDDGIPWLFEVAIAKTEYPGAVTYAINYGAAFGDPFKLTRLSADGVTTTGAESFLYRSDAYPEDDRNRAVAVHVVSPGLEFVEKSKTALTVPTEVADAFATILAAATKELRAAKKKAERSALAEKKRQEQLQRARPNITLKDAVFTVMPEAITEASDNETLPFNTRNLFYAVRPRIQPLTTEELEWNYFSQTLVVAWEREHGPIPGHYRDPRGELREPHTGKVVRLGTREVADYILPDDVFDKILYIEKEGLNPIFAAARLAERYDMAIASGKGQPAEAVRALFERAHAGNYKLFVLHDADHSGYIIARAIAEATARMPDYNVDVIDLGLKVGQAIDLGMPTERYERKAELPRWMPDRLDEQETAWFGGRLLTPSWQAKDRRWECTRVELNALGAPGLVRFIETELEAHGAATKVIPADAKLRATAADAHRDAITDLVNEVLGELFDLDTIVDILAENTANVPDIDQDAVRAALYSSDGRPLASPWRDAVGDLVVDRLAGQVDLRERIRSLLT